MFLIKKGLCFVFLICAFSISAQVDYFPELNAAWSEKTPSELDVDSEWLQVPLSLLKLMNIRAQEI